MRPMLERLTRYWDEDRCLTALLILLVTAILVVPLADFWLPALARPIRAVTVTLILLSGTGTTGRRTAGLSLAIAVGLGPMVAWLLFDAAKEAIDVAETALNGAFILVLAVLVLRSVFRAGPITWHRIRGSIAGFLMLGLTFSLTYRVVEMADPAAFFQPGAPPGPVTAPVLTYFSFVTLATLGYGDIVPVNPLARSLAILESLTGLMYPAVLIARLVSLQLAAELGRKPHD